MVSIFLICVKYDISDIYSKHETKLVTCLKILKMQFRKKKKTNKQKKQQKKQTNKQTQKITLLFFLFVFQFFFQTPCYGLFQKC